MQKLTINDLPADVLAKMKGAIAENTEVKRLKEKRENLLKGFHVVEAAKIMQQLKRIEENVINQWLDNYEGETVRMNDLIKEIPEPERERLLTYINAMIFLSDMVDGFSVGINDILRKYHPDCRVEMFDRLSHLGKEAQEHIKFMSNHTDMNFQLSFGEGADDVTELLLNKVKSFMRKQRNKQKTNESV